MTRLRRSPDQQWERFGRLDPFFAVLTDERYFWRGEWNYVRLDPQSQPAHILSVQLTAPLPAEPAEPRA